jgi:competence protein ComEA
MSSGANGKAGMAAVVGLAAVIVGGSVYARWRASSTPPTFIEAPKTTAPLPTQPPSQSLTQPTAETQASKPIETNTVPKLNTQPAAEEIVVHVTGAVKKPGVLHLPVGSRVMDALTQAGGATKNANTDALNLASKLEDGSQIYVPTRKEEPKALAQKEYETGNTPVVTPAKPEPSKFTPSAAKPSSSSSGSSGRNSAKLTDPSQGTVNINKAGEEELQRLPGVGPSTAAKIAAFRQESGNFQTAEDLMEVSGIGPKKFAKMKPFVRVK